MAETNPIIRYGICGLAAVNRTTGLPFGRARVIGEVAFNLGGELVKLFGGTSLFPHAANPGVLESTLNMKLKEFPPFLSELYMGVTPVDTTTPSTTGEISVALANKVGTSLVDATTGIDSVALDGVTADVRFAAYAIIAVSATTVDIFAYDDVDFARETAVVFQDDALKINAAPITVPGASATVNIPNTGIDIVGGSGAIAFVTSDTGLFETNPTFNRKIVTTLPATGLVFPEHKIVIVGERQGTVGLHKMDVFRVKGVGLPRTFGEKAFAETEINAAVLADSVQGVYKETEIVS